MSRDRFISFSQNRPPNKEEVEKQIRGYGPLFFRSIDWLITQNRFLLTLPGRLEKYEEVHARVIEVVLTDKTIDVLTRQMDTLTNDVADGLARVIARQWLGTLHWSDFPAPQRPEEDKNYYVLRFQDSKEMEEALGQVRDFSLEKSCELDSVVGEKKVGFAHKSIHHILKKLLQKDG